MKGYKFLRGCTGSTDGDFWLAFFALFYIYCRQKEKEPLVDVFRRAFIYIYI
ncbi:hypothetical protein ES332_A05G346800v1 [Gossypium tomentosum]|uniref:Uncharacterized protein n=1 Tax=Gossypium tomentosum TaxID=34277 RepID=A0A5D2QMN0_GOSTO|nr:hypothetical protein ES332_A05G346800v1 [Gossypium tomentosum]